MDDEPENQFRNSKDLSDHRSLSESEVLTDLNLETSLGTPVMETDDEFDSYNLEELIGRELSTFKNH